MEKKFSKSKIIILSIAILVAILSLSIAIFGMIKKNNDKQTNNNVKAWGSDDGIKLRTISQTINGVTYSVEYTSDSVIFKYDFKECLVGYIYGSTFEYTNGSYTGTYIKKDEFTIKNFTVYNDDGYKLYNYLRSSGLYIQYYYIDYDSIGSDDISSKNFTYTCSNIRFYLTEGPIFITVDGVQYSKGINRTSGDMGYFDVSNKEILWCTSSGQIDIKSEEALKLLAYEIVDTACINNDSLRSADVYLKRNLDMSLVKNMIPIGTSGVPFCGTFDGNGYTITKLPVCSSYYTTRKSNTTYHHYNYGLFGFINNATIKKLHIKETNWELANKRQINEEELRAGLLCGFAEGNSIIESCFLYECSIKVVMENYTTVPQLKIGALLGEVGELSVVTIQNNAVVCDFDAFSYRTVKAGGLLGVNNGLSTVDCNYYKGKIKLKAVPGCSIYFGGISSGDGNVSATSNYIAILDGEIFTESYTYDISSADGNSDCIWYQARIFAYDLSKNLSKNEYNYIYINSNIKCHEEEIINDYYIEDVNTLLVNKSKSQARREQIEGF